jgi:putative cardiolipin synthase
MTIIFLVIHCNLVMALDLQEVSESLPKHPNTTGLYVLEKGEDSLLARAWLTDKAQKSITIQYFIWSVDNIGILAAEALLRAAERGVHVRVIVDDLLMDAPSDSLIALSAHPNVEIRIYNPVHKTGISKVERVFHLLTDFRNSNQRMHDKTFVVDGRFAITGGRNMADEYFDYDQKYNFRDRDILVVDGVVKDIENNFENFWNSKLSHPIESLLNFEKLFTNKSDIERIQEELHHYAADPTNFAPTVRQALVHIDEVIPQIVDELVWTEASFIHDNPGKNDGKSGLSGGGNSTTTLAHIVQTAKKRIVIQTPYLVMPEGALEVFKNLIAQGVEIRINTNSLGSTDNLMAFSGYRKQREKILEAGIQVYEFKPEPAIQEDLIQRYPDLKENAPIFAIHAKTMVIDGKVLYIGTFNLDPRSANLNTEVGIIVKNAKLAETVEQRIENDMSPENSWQADVASSDKKSSLGKRLRLKLWEIFPLDSLL